MRPGSSCQARPQRQYRRAEPDPLAVAGTPRSRIFTRETDLDGMLAPAGGGLSDPRTTGAVYLADHGITASVVDGKFVSFDIGAAADPSFSYFVQIGNKGTWSTAAVDVTAPRRRRGRYAPQRRAHGGVDVREPHAGRW